jgi:adenylyltransferase/sulfurtransferase
MNPDLSKYQRQIKLQSFGLDNQLKLSVSQVLIIGMGGLGIPVAQYLNAMGVGTLGIMDDDRIEAHNLQRQVLYSEQDVGQSKAEIAAVRLQKQNSQTTIKKIQAYLTKENALETIKAYDIVVDATDNFATRYLINDACVLLNKPFVYGALHDFEGQVSVFNYENGPTYRCLFPSQPNTSEIPNCDENGVLGVLPGIIGSLQALEVVKVLTGIGDVLSGRLLIYNGLTQENRLVQFKANPITKKRTQLEESYDIPLCTTELTIEADAFLELKCNKQVIDVRSETEFAVHHLDNAKNLPLPDLSRRVHQIDFGLPIYVVCQSGQRSAMATQQLTQKYPTAQVYSVNGGMNQIAALCH